MLRPLGRVTQPHAMRKTVLRAVTALTAAGLVARALRLRGAAPVPSEGGRWRELSGPDLR